MSVSIIVHARESGLVVFQEDGRRTQGEPPVLVAESVHCEECGQEHEIEACPRCGAYIYLGYGLAFGGFGSYKACEADCGWFFKEFDQEG